ncbi:uncharacterized protein LOC129590421 isoform X2 [Paramacrobiotus metropolitanus]|uniref:uncharacterized protein LOC129590421 isoform X2 n=1 Tax=Paramacrobiotus metropolitanus TaxID=2943436 RepID=UPI0024460EE6|nr:uncharacterized protein LOC129590421 isoform X2 [Paramacrobiotus metropolitanus]
MAQPPPSGIQRSSILSTSSSGQSDGSPPAAATPGTIGPVIISAATGLAQQPLEMVQNQVRANFRQVLGVGHPHAHATILQQRAAQLRPAVPTALETQVRTTLMQALNPFEDQNTTGTGTEASVRNQIIRALSQAQQQLTGTQTQLLQSLGIQPTPTSLDEQLRTPLLQALNLSQQDLTVHNQRLQRAAASAPPPSPVAAPSPTRSVEGGWNLAVNPQLLGAPEPSTKEDYLFLADCSFRAHRHEELLNHVRAFLMVRDGKRDLLKDERYFIAVAYKDSVRNVRDSWRKIRRADVEAKDTFKAKTAANYRAELEIRMRVICNEGLMVSSKILSEVVSSLETRLYFQKVKGDLYRYIAEYSTGVDRVEASSLGRTAYEEADRIKTCVSAVHPLRLGLALNFGVFLRDACQDSGRGWRVTKAALDDANRGFQMLAELDANDYRESNGLLMNLRRNLMRWNTAEIDMETQNPNYPVNLRG